MVGSLGQKDGIETKQCNLTLLFFKFLVLDHGLEKNSWQADPLFINKVLLEHSYTNCLHIVSGYFQSTRTELSSCDRDCMAHKPYIVSGPLRMSWPF